MLYNIEIKSEMAILMHCGSAGLDTSSPQKQEIAKLTAKRGNNKTIADAQRIAELECQLAIWYDADGLPTIPTEAFRSCLENAARKRKQGPPSSRRTARYRIEVHIRYRTIRNNHDRTRHINPIHQSSCRATSTHPENQSQVRRLELHLHCR